MSSAMLICDRLVCMSGAMFMFALISSLLNRREHD
jgi:hypothetical protein